MNDAPAYGLWSLVIVNSAIFILFAFSFFKQRTEAAVRKAFGEAYERYAAMTPAFFPRMERMGMGSG